MAMKKSMGWVKFAALFAIILQFIIIHLADPAFLPHLFALLGDLGIASAIAGMSDVTIMSKNGSLFVNGPQVVSAVAGKVMTLAGISNYLSGIITGNISTQGGFLLMINIIFLFMGTFMDINATILIMTPLLLPVATKYAVDPIQEPPPPSVVSPSTLEYSVTGGL